jgi:ABC-type phosphate transport system substrate-binding protein
MQTMRIMCSPRARIVALAVGLGALGSFATAPAALAAGAGPKPPAVGTNCQADGKINGGGSTFQTNALNNAFTFGFQQDVCGPQPNVSNLNSSWGTTDPSVFSFTVGSTTNNVAGMVAYNYSLGGTSLTNGSGAGLRRLSCRTDMFAGTDLPYNNAQLGTPGNTTVAGLDGPPGSESGGTAPPYNCDNGTLNTTAVPPPYGPQPSAGPWPASGDTAANAMSFPVAGGAVAFAANLNGMCTGGTPTGLNITQSEFDGIMQGTINQWNDPALVATDPILSTDGCSGNITRVVRQDNSGTTAISMFTLNGIDKNNLCGSDSSTNWYTIATASSNAGQWPQGCTDGNGNVAPNPAVPSTTGSPAVISLTDSTNGGFGYAELGLWGTNPAGVSFVNLQNSTGSAFVSPGSAGAKSNCTLPTAVPTGSTPAQAVGLGATTWTNTGTPTAPGKQDIADTGACYPACGLTFDLVYSNLTEAGEVAGSGGTAGCTGSSVITGACQTVGGPVAGVTNDQLRTLYSYFTYMFSPLAQSSTAGSYLPNQTLDPLPATWLTSLVQGFQQNF